MTNIKTLVALLIAGAAITACSSDDAAVEKQPEVPSTTGKYTLTVKASKEDSGTRALSLMVGVGTMELKPVWNEHDDVTLKSGTESVKMTVTPDATDDTKATLTATLTTAPADGDELTLELCSSSISGQTGTLDYIASHCDYATATVTVTSVDGGVITTSASETPAEFVNQNAIARFTLYNGSTLISPTQLEVSISHSDPTVQAYLAAIGKDSYTFTIPAETYTYSAGVLYFALPSMPASVTIGDNLVTLTAADFTLKLTATTANGIYTYTKTGYPFTAGQFYNIAVKMLPVGAISGKFTVNNSGKQVYFSKGNLQATYDDHDWSWAFAEHQWDYIGNNPANTSVKNSSPWINGTGTVDLFGWSTDNNNVNYYGINSQADNGTYSGSFVDWGSLAITNGGNMKNSGWRTLTNDEWYYLLNTRVTGSTVNGISNARYATATVNGVYGMILFPDDVTIAAGEASWGAIPTSSTYGYNTCTLEQWTALETKGCVFLPAAGHRSGTNVENVTTYPHGYYWTSTSSSANEVCYMTFTGLNLVNAPRYSGYSVRLVKDAQ